ncbi:MAG: hypothetical protein KA419_17350 [Acidobacteria bacterium]|nr:hypothetical protein [Acidobacteriota bacterium]
MWRLIRAELSYRVVLQAPAVAVVLALYLGLTALPDLLYLPAVPFPRKMTVAFVALSYLAVIGAFHHLTSPHGAWRRERRARFLLALPVTPRQVGLARVLIPVLEWAGFCATLLLALLLAGDWATFWSGGVWPRALATLTGAFWAGSSWLMGLDDLGERLGRGRRPRTVRLADTLSTVAVASTVLFFVTFCLFLIRSLPGAPPPEPVRGAVTTFWFGSWTGAATLCLGGAAMLLASVGTFAWRRAYLA